MNTELKLCDYGIMQEKSDIRAHVGVVARCVFVYRTREGVALLLSGKYELRPAYQPGVEGPTAWGAPVPVSHFKDIRRLRVSGWPQFEGWTETLCPTEKGRRAVDVVVSLLARGRFPLWVTTQEDSRQSVQIKGADIVVFANQKIQVKCDYRAGDAPGCSGNLYLQTRERNPKHLH
jgi:hypothetical protein